MLESNPLKEFQIRVFTFAEIKHSDWMLQVKWLVLTNQGASFQSRVLNSEIVYEFGLW